MFARTTLRRVSSFALFIKESKAHPKLQGLRVPQRGKMVAELYRALPASELAALQKRALTTKFNRSLKAPKVLKDKRAPSPYNIFVKQNMSKFSGSAPERIKAIAKLWREKGN